MKQAPDPPHIYTEILVGQRNETGIGTQFLRQAAAKPFNFGKRLRFQLSQGGLLGHGGLLESAYPVGENSEHLIMGHRQVLARFPPSVLGFGVGSKRGTMQLLGRTQLDFSFGAGGRRLEPLQFLVRGVHRPSGALVTERRTMDVLGRLLVQQCLSIGDRGLTNTRLRHEIVFVHERLDVTIPFALITIPVRIVKPGDHRHQLRRQAKRRNPGRHRAHNKNDQNLRGAESAHNPQETAGRINQQNSEQQEDKRQHGDLGCRDVDRLPILKIRAKQREERGKQCAYNQRADRNFMGHMAWHVLRAAWCVRDSITTHHAFRTSGAPSSC
ncbi:MAG: hypothetical protein QF541_16555 [Lentisphaeria bacterium]|nr:hypothetical protein [Lentisphaeria bacterium]